MDRLKELIIVFGIGSFTYALIEVIFRGYTHWTMFITGGIVFCVLYSAFNYFRNENIIKVIFLGAIMITTIEYSVGCIVNLTFKMKVWDYSGKALNLYGQICPLFFLAWLGISIPVFFISTNLKEKLISTN